MGGFLLDGGMGSALLATQQIGPQEIATACVQHAELVGRVHRGFLEAGSRLIQSNSFGANRLALRACGARESAADLNARAVEIAQQQARDYTGVFVAGNLGPARVWAGSDEVLAEGELASVFHEQGAALQAAGVDLFSLETFGGQQEACLAIRALRELSDLPIAACLTFVKRGEQFTTLAGEPLFAALAALRNAGADLVGVNCASGSSETLELLRSAQGTDSIPDLAKPNAGLPLAGSVPAVYTQSPADFAREMAEVAHLGVLAVGGCCGADAAFIASLRSALAGCRSSNDS